ncbi:RING finger protein 145-like [Ostrea edulis]|uniref:RING finger protein 145-like n=1 Tax=Ostrea edulis TaxID=37623 RepID=UPI0024AF5BD2|nr:RING finger protein 145-like [Ostrea edulis]
MPVLSIYSHFLIGLTIVLRQPAFFLIEICLEETFYQSFIVSTVLVASMAAILLPQDHLFSVYKYLCGAALMFMMHSSTRYLIDKSRNHPDNNDNKIVGHFIIFSLAELLAFHLFKEKTWKPYVLSAYHLPLITRFLKLPITITGCSFHLADGLVSSYLIYQAIQMFITGVVKIKKQVTTWIYLVNIFGFFPVIKSIANSIHLTQQLLLFYFVSFSYKLYYYTAQTSGINVVPLSKLDATTFLFVIAGQCCKTYVGLVSMCVATSYLSHYLSRLVNLYLYGWKSTGIVSDISDVMLGAFVFVLSVSAGILGPSNSLNEFILKGSVFKTILMWFTLAFIICTYGMVDPTILTFSSMPTSKPFKHFRWLTLYMYFLVFTMYIIYNRQQYNNIPLIIIGFSTCLQIMASIVIYFFFVYDGVCSHSMENLNDIIFYIRFTVRFQDFVGSLILACRGIWFITNGAFSWIQIPFFILNCYENVWKRLKSCSRIVVLRRDAFKKLNVLETATNEQIQKCDDVCSICIRQMSSAKITPCGHLFHETCLKKWIYVRDSCPLCLHKLYSIGPDTTQ